MTAGRSRSHRGREWLRRPLGTTISRIALTNAFCNLVPLFFETHVLAIGRQWALPIHNTTLFVGSDHFHRAGLRALLSLDDLVLDLGALL